MRQNWRRDLVGLVSVGGFAFVCIIVLRGGEIVPSMKDVGLILLGQLSMKFGTVIDYYYGSSSGSKEKDAVITGLTKPGP